MSAWTIITGLLIAVNITAALLGSLGKKSLRHSVVRLEKLREDRVARLKVLIKRRKSMNGTCKFMRRRRGDLKRLVTEQEDKFKRLEEGEEFEEEVAEGEVAENVGEGQELALAGEEPVDDGEGKKISSWMDKKEQTDKENMLREEKKIRTRFSNDKEN